MEFSNKNQDSSGCSNRICDIIVKNLLLLTTLIGVVLALILGIGLRSYDLSEDTIHLIGYPGELFLRMLKLLTLPLLISSIVTVSANLHADVSGKMTFRALMYFVLTTMLAIFIGFAIALTILPDAADVGKVPVETEKKNGGFLDSILDLGRNLFPENLFQATFEQAHTIYVESEENTMEMIRKLAYRSGPNTMGLVVFCLFFGFGVNGLGERGSTIQSFFSATFEVLLSITTKVMWLSGIGVCSIITAKLLSIDNLPEVLSSLAYFMGSVILGIFIHQLVMMPAIFFIFLRQNPYKFYFSLMDPWILAFAVCSSVVTLPTTLNTMINKLKYDERVAKFVITLGVPLNTDGTAIFLAIASVFVARLSGVTLDLSSLIIVLITTTAVSMAMPSVPSASLVVLLMILSAIDVDPRDVSLLFAVDWILDRFRTTSNVLADCFAAAVVQKLSEKELKGVKRNEEDGNFSQTVSQM